MKTRVIQNDPDEPTTPEQPANDLQPSTRSTNLAGRMGRWSARHRKIAIFGWLTFVILVFAFGTFKVGKKTIDSKTEGPGESGRMEKILDESFKRPAGESVLVQSSTLTVRDPAFAAAIDAVVTRISKLADVQNVRSPLDAQNAGQISTDKHAALIDFQIRGDAKKAREKVDVIVAAVAEVQTTHPQVFVGEFGPASASKAVKAVFSNDLKKAGLLSLPVTLIILVIALGALVAAGIPLLLGLTAVLATMGLLALPSQLLPVDEEVFAVVLLVGLAVGVDYAMFYLKREREERAAGRSEQA